MSFLQSGLKLEHGPTSTPYSLSPSPTMATHPILNRSSSITVVQRDNGKQTSVKIDVVLSDPVLSIVEEACKHFNLAEYWKYALYSPDLYSWIHDAYPFSHYPLAFVQTLYLAQKTPEFWELEYLSLGGPGRSSLSSKPSKGTLSKLFSRNDQTFHTKYRPSSIYLATILFNSEDKILLTSTGLVPAFPIILKDSNTYSKFEEGGTDFTWAMKTSMDWEHRYQRTQHKQQMKKSNASHADDDLASIHSSSDDGASINSLPLGNPKGKYEEPKSFRDAFQTAVAMMKKELGIDQLGVIYDNVVEIKAAGIKFIVTIAYAPMAGMSSIAKDYVSRGTLRWQTPDKLNPMYDTKTEDVWLHASTIYNDKRTVYTGGLYLAVFHAESTASSVSVLLPKQRKNCLPMYKIRPNPALTEAEWSWVQSLALDSPPSDIEEETSEQYQQFKASFNVAISRLSEQTRLTLDAKDVFTEDTVQITKRLDGSTMALFSSEEDVFSSEEDVDQSESLIDTESDKQLSEPGSPDSTTPIAEVRQLQSKEIPQTPIRIIFIVKPMRQASQNRSSIAYNYHDFTFYPFHVFDILHHSVYNSSIYAPLRNMMLNLQDTYQVIRKQNNETVLNLSLPEEHLELKPPSLSPSVSTDSRRPSLSTTDDSTAPSSVNDEALTILSDEMSALTGRWSKLSWSFRLIDFDRKRILHRAGMRLPLTPSSSTTIKLNIDDSAINGSRRKSRVGSLREVVRESGNRALQSAMRLQGTTNVSTVPNSRIITPIVDTKVDTDTLAETATTMLDMLYT